ncbi:zinc finger BED domain-containing protein RICESLEEPER 2-like protein [Tanacetum coccineum]|uniref:Zinc finger BED domain-containing protein RICESLEEPER 2-like protein n=1 Tax=Tanacetum coccineum TaxID=301880 RepID=A0ABQ5A7C8_9ASTR
MIDGSDLTNYGFATHGFVGTAFDDDHSKKKLAYRHTVIAYKFERVCLGWYTIDWYGSVCSFMYSNIKFSLKFRAWKEAAQKGKAKQPPWPSSRGKAINESTASWTKVICLAIKFLKINSASRSLDDEEEPKWMDREWAKITCSGIQIDVPPGIREVKAMADMHQRKAGTAKHSDNEEDVEVSEEKTHDIDTSQSLQKVEQHLQTLCFSAHRSLVIQRALPFNHFDPEQTTRVFQNTMQPRYTHVSRSTLKRDAMKLWLAAKQEIIDSFGNINACVNLTTDVWSAPHGVPGSYMCVSAHRIEPDTWQMMKRVISFEEFPSFHTGGALFKMLTKVLTNFNLKDKVMSITLDNASNNTSAIDDQIDENDEEEEPIRQCALWSREEEILLTQCWIETSENGQIRADRSEDSFWGQIMDDFNTGTTQGYRTRHMLMGKWTRINGDCQNFNAIYKHLERKSGENEADHIEAAKITFAAQQLTGRKFQLEHCWRILKGHSKWDAPKPLDTEDHTEIFSPDVRPRPARKNRPAKKTKSETTGSTGGSASGSLSDYVSDDLRHKLQAGTSAYEAEKEKEVAMMVFKEMEFLTIDVDLLPEPKASIIRNQQEKIIAKYAQKLDARNLVRCKSVCKSWKSLISESRFIKAHYNHSSNRHKRIGEVVFLSSTDYGHPIIGSSCGLVCFSAGHELLVANPLTKEVKAVPKPFAHVKVFPRPNARERDDSSSCWGFGYDSLRGDYKVVLAVKKGKDQSYFQVFSLKSNAWNVIGEVNYTSIGWQHSVLCNEALHWVMHPKKSK